MATTTDTLRSRTSRELMTANAACKTLGIVPYTLQRLALTGRVRVLIEPGANPRYYRAEIEALAAGQKQEAAK